MCVCSSYPCDGHLWSGSGPAWLCDRAARCFRCTRSVRLAARCINSVTPVCILHGRSLEEEEGKAEWRPSLIAATATGSSRPRQSRSASLCSRHISCCPPASIEPYTSQTLTSLSAFSSVYLVPTAATATGSSRPRQLLAASLVDSR